MTALLGLAYAAHWLLILAWAACHPLISKTRRRACRPVALDPNRRPAVTVILPAKDEAANLPDCAERILRQQGIDLRLIIVDDRSADSTAELADRIAARDSRCRVIHNRRLPDGWLGKSHACWLAAADASAEWLLFTDADVRLEPPAVAAAIAHADAHQLDLFSLWPRDASAGFWERLLIPLCGAMIVLWYGRAAAGPGERRYAFANGQFLLIRRAAYQACGGHAAVRTALIEDIPLARAAAAAGFRVGSAPGPDLAAVRMYDSLTGVIRGWRRIFAGVLTPPQITGCLLSLLVGSLLPCLLTPLLALRVSACGATPWSLAWLLSGAAHLFVLMSVSVRFFSLARCDLRFLLVYPLAVVGVVLILLDALRLQVLGGAVSWRGTAYSVRSGQRLAPPAAAPDTGAARNGTHPPSPRGIGP